MTIILRCSRLALLKTTIFGGTPLRAEHLGPNFPIRSKPKSDMPEKMKIDFVEPPAKNTEIVYQRVHISAVQGRIARFVRGQKRTCKQKVKIYFLEPLPENAELVCQTFHIYTVLCAMQAEETRISFFWAATKKRTF